MIAAIKRALASIRRAFRAPPSLAALATARRDGFNDARHGFTQDDYPLTYADGELREAWLEGWHDYHKIDSFGDA